MEAVTALKDYVPSKADIVRRVHTLIQHEDLDKKQACDRVADEIAENGVRQFWRRFGSSVVSMIFLKERHNVDLDASETSETSGGSNSRGTSSGGGSSTRDMAVLKTRVPIGDDGYWKRIEDLTREEVLICVSSWESKAERLQSRAAAGRKIAEKMLDGETIGALLDRVEGVKPTVERFLGEA